jgi:hypothetical protein
LVAVIFEVVVIVLLYRPAANEFFRTAPPSVARAVP